MRVTHTLTRLAAAFWIAVLLNGAVVAAFDRAANHARAEGNAQRLVNVA